jgi:Maltokinase N-terminal cap domain
MALIYQAQLHPSKIELLSSWVPSQPWLGDADATQFKAAELKAAELTAIGAYRFDDPAGEVGIETHLLQTCGGQLFQVPLTYRNEPLDGAESALLGTMQHSVLGERWVYDGCADPVYVTALATAILGGGTEAPHEVVTDGGNVLRPTTTKVVGSGSPGTAIPVLGSVSCASEKTTTVISTADLTLVVLRVIDTATELGGSGDALTLSGTWPGREAPALLALALRT